MKLDLFIPSNKSDLWNKLAHELKMPPWYALNSINRGLDPIEPVSRHIPSPQFSLHMHS